MLLRAHTLHSRRHEPEGGMEPLSTPGPSVPGFHRGSDTDYPRGNGLRGTLPALSLHSFSGATVLTAEGDGSLWQSDCVPSRSLLQKLILMPVFSSLASYTAWD